MSITLIGIYSPPPTSNDFYEELQAILKECNWKKEIIIFGDFNVDWLIKSKRKKLKSIADKHDLVQLIESPTRISKTTETCIDLIFTNRKDRICKTFNMLTGLSDHNLVLFSRKLSKNRFIRPFNKPSEQVKVPKSEMNNLGIALNNIKWSELIAIEQLKDKCKTFTNIIQETVNHFSKRVRTKPQKHLPWLNEEIWTLMKQRDQALKIAWKTGTTTDRQIFTSLRNKVVKEIRTAKAGFFLSML